MHQNRDKTKQERLVDIIGSLNNKIKYEIAAVWHLIKEDRHSRRLLKTDGFQLSIVNKNCLFVLLFGENRQAVA